LGCLDGDGWTAYTASHHGLPVDSVSALVADPQRGVWIGTSRGGLARHDGESLRYFPFGAAPDSQRHAALRNPVSVLAVDAQGELWAGFGRGRWWPCESSGFARYDGRYLTVHTPLLSRVDNDGAVTAISDSLCEEIGQVPGGEGPCSLPPWEQPCWYAVGFGLYPGLGERALLGNWSSEPPPLFGPATAFAFDGAGRMWMGTGGGLFSYDGEWWSLYDTNPVTGLAMDSLGHLWVGIGRKRHPALMDGWGDLEKGRLLRYDGENWQEHDTGNSGLPGDSVGALALDGQGRLWIDCDDRGVAVYCPDGVVLPEFTAVTEGDPSPPSPALMVSQSYPNPFNSGTAIRFTLPDAQDVQLSVHNLAGQRVVTLVNGPYQPGVHTIPWDGRDDAGRPVASGVYLYELRGGGCRAVRKMALLK
jgi:hypothetical protein